VLVFRVPILSIYNLLLLLQTSLNMPGFSLTILLLPRAVGPSGSASLGNTPSEALVLSLLDEKPDVPGWKWSSAQPPPNSSSTGSHTHPTPPAQAGSDHATSHIKIPAANPNGFVQAIVRACEALKEAEPEITKMDQIAGDGDCGLTLKAGAEGVYTFA
jgi:dihydroxyacetone kinase